MKSNKDVIAKCLSGVTSLLDKNMELCKSAAAENDRLKNEKIQTQKEVIKSQRSQIGSVQETVKEEIQSWAAIVGKNYKAVSRAAASQSNQWSRLSEK